MSADRLARVQAIVKAWRQAAGPDGSHPVLEELEHALGFTSTHVQSAGLALDLHGFAQQAHAVELARK